MQTENGVEFLSRIGCENEFEHFERALFSSPLRPPEIIEIMGAAGSGKSLLALSMLANVLLPKSIVGVALNGLESGALYIDCDQHFSILHFSDLLERKIKMICYNTRAQWKKLGDIKKNEELLTIKKEEFNNKVKDAVKKCLSRMIYIKCTDSNQLAVTLTCLDSYIKNKHNVCLVVIDSISSFYWRDRIYKVDNFNKMESYLNSLTKKFIATIKNNHLICIAIKQNLFKDKKENESTNSSLFFSDYRKLDNSPYEYIGKEWSKGVTIKLNLTVENGDSSTNHLLTEEDSNYCKIEINRGNCKRLIHCTFHEHGTKWLHET